MPSLFLILFETIILVNNTMKYRYVTSYNCVKIILVLIGSYIIKKLVIAMFNNIFYHNIFNEINIYFNYQID